MAVIILQHNQVSIHDNETKKEVRDYMQKILSETADRIQYVVQKNGSVTLAQLETILDTSFNLIFLAIDTGAFPGK